MGAVVTVLPRAACASLAASVFSSFAAMRSKSHSRSPRALSVGTLASCAATGFQSRTRCLASSTTTPSPIDETTSRCRSSSARCLLAFDSALSSLWASASMKRFTSWATTLAARAVKPYSAVENAICWPSTMLAVEYSTVRPHSPIPS